MPCKRSGWKRRQNPTGLAFTVQFTAGELNEFNTALAKIEVKGARLPDAVLVYSDVEAPVK